MDIVDRTTRSRMMSGIRGKDTKAEITVRSLLHRKGFRFRLDDRRLPGRPDIVLPRYHAVIFVHGCFWHGHDCHLFRMPQTHGDFWRTKIASNQARDRKVREALLEAGWRVGIVWECAIRGSRADAEKAICGVEEWLPGTENTFEARG